MQRCQCGYRSTELTIHVEESRQLRNCLFSSEYGQVWFKARALGARERRFESFYSDSDDNKEESMSVMIKTPYYSELLLIQDGTTIEIPGPFTINNDYSSYLGYIVNPVTTVTYTSGEGYTRKGGKNNMITHVQVDDLPFLVQVDTSNELSALEQASSKLRSISGRKTWTLTPTRVEYVENRAVLYTETTAFSDVNGNMFVRTEDDDFVHISELSGG